MNQPPRPASSRQVKVPLPLLDQIDAKARRENTTTAAKVARHITDWAEGAPTPQLLVAAGGQIAAIPGPEARFYDQQKTVETRQVSFRLPHCVWSAAQDRASRELTTVSAVANRFLRAEIANIL